MSKILIVGDSNGLGEWGTVVPGPGVANGSELFRPYNDEWYLLEPHAKPFQVVWPGFGYYLDQKGHATVNYSIGGGNNTEALFKTEEALGLAPPFTSPVFYNPDVIVWVVTEPIRDLQMARWPAEAGLKDLEKYYVQRDLCVKEATSIADLNSRLIKMCLDNAQKIYNETKVPWIIVEGWGKLPQDLSQYNFIKYVHRNWMDKILGHEIPVMSSWPTINLLRRARTDLTDASAIIKTAPDSEFKRIVDSYEDTINTMEKSDKFPDNCHPDRKVHEQLAKELEPYV